MSQSLTSNARKADSLNPEEELFIDSLTEDNAKRNATGWKCVRAMFGLAGTVCHVLCCCLFVHVFLPSKISKKNSKKIDIYLAKLLFKSKKTSVLYMLSKIGYDTKPAYKLKKNFTLLIKIYQMHYRNSNSDGILDNETFEVIKSHFNHLLTSH